MCPQCYEKIQKNLNANPAVKKAVGKMMKKRYQKGGRHIEDFIKHCTKGD